MPPPAPTPQCASSTVTRLGPVGRSLDNRLHKRLTSARGGSSSIKPASRMRLRSPLIAIAPKTPRTAHRDDPAHATSSRST